MVKFGAKLVFWCALIAGLGFVVTRKTPVYSYVSTFFTKVSDEAEHAIPTKFELDRIRQEIRALDGDICTMLRPIAEYKACIEKLTKNITTEQETLDKNKKALLSIAADLDPRQANPPKFVTIGTRKLPVSQVSKQLDRDTQMLQKTEARLKTQMQVLTAKEEALRATQEQMAKVISKKRDYEVRLAQLEADEETLKIAKIGSDIQIDTSRSTQIEDALAKVEQRLKVEKNHLELRQTPSLSLLTQEVPKDAPVDLLAIRKYLENNEEATVSVK